MTDKMEETFLSRASKERGGKADLENYETPQTVSRVGCIVDGQHCALSNGIESFQWGNLVLRKRDAITLARI